MPTVKLSVDQFIRDVAACGLLTTTELDAIKNALPAGDARADPAELARKLVASGKLTKFQATIALQGKAKNLVFGEYVLLTKIGAGGMGDVFKAEHRRMKRVVALKVLPPAAVKSPEAVKRFQQEVQAAARLDHANIVTAHDAGERHGVHFLVMQYVDGRDLSSLVDERGPLPVPKAVSYVLQAARGLAYAHSKGVIHRDVKPANLLVNSEGVVKILDMGIARLQQGPPSAGEKGALTISGDVIGTADYMSPEQAEDSHQADARSDIYSLGCTLYFLLTGQSPYQGATAVKKMLAHREQPIPSLAARRADVPAGLDRTFARMVAKQPAERFQNVPDLIAALEPYESTAAGAVNAAWAAPVSALAESSTSLTMSGANETVSASSKSATLLESTVVQKTWSMTAKVAGGVFGTVVAPLVVAFILKYLDKPEAPPPAASAPGGASTASVASSGPVANAAADGSASKRMPSLELLPGKAADLSKLIDLDRDAVRGTWYLKDGVLQLRRSQSERHSILRLPVDPPAEYDLTFTASRPKDASGNNGLFFAFALDGERGAVMMDGTQKAGRIWAMQQVDGKPLANNGTAVTGKPTLSETPTRIVVEVRHDGVKVSANGEPALIWHGVAKHLSLPATWNAVPNIPSLCFMSASDFDISQITLTPGGNAAELFNSRDLTGWTADDLSHWKVNSKKKILMGTNENAPVWLFTEREYGDLRLSLQFNMMPDTNSGVALRAAPGDKEPEHLQIELRNDIEPTVNLATGTLLNGGVAKHRNLPPVAPATLNEPPEWNDFDAEFRGNRLRVWINGVQVQDVDFARLAQSPRGVPAVHRTRGRIGLQILQGEAHFRKIELSEIKD